MPHMEAGVNFPGAHNPGTMQAPYWGKTANNGASGKKEANRAGDRGEKGTFRCLFPSRSQLNSICRSPICLRISNIKSRKKEIKKIAGEKVESFILFSSSFLLFLQHFPGLCILTLPLCSSTSTSFPPHFLRVKALGTKLYCTYYFITA